MRLIAAHKGYKTKEVINNNNKRNSNNRGFSLLKSNAPTFYSNVKDR